MKVYVINFIKAYMGHDEKSTQGTDFCPKKSIFSTGDQSYENKSLIFQFFVGVGVYVKISCLQEHLFGMQNTSRTV